MTCVNDASIIEPLNDVLNSLKSDHPQITKLLKQEKDKMAVLEIEEGQAICQLSMLEVIERIELYVWSLGTPRSNFMLKWRRTNDINHSLSANEYITDWARWWYNGRALISTIANGRHENLFRYILKEYETFLSGNDIHFDIANLNYSSLELEHIFPQSFQNLPYTSYGFRTESEYNSLLWRSGNLTFLPQKCNDALGNNMPDLKSSEYENCAGHPVNSGKDIATKLQIVKKIGDDLLPIGSTLVEYRKALEIRCVEIANFCLNRFLGF